MASLTWILLFCTLLSAVPCSTGINFYITRSPGYDFCANSECSYDANVHESDKFSVKQISVYDVTQPGNKFQLAYRKLGDADTYLDPTKLNDINGTSDVTKFHADIRLNFRNPTDCLYETYVCEVVYVDDSGKKQTARKTIAPDTPDVDNDCSCSSITYNLDRLTNRANGASRQLYGLTLNLDNIRVDYNAVRNGTAQLSSDIARLQESHANIQVSVNNLREADRAIDGKMNDLRHTDSDLESQISDIQNANEDRKQTIAVIRQSKTNTDKQLSQLTRNDNSQLDSIESLQQTDGIFQNDMNNLENSDNVLKAQVESLRTESSSLTAQIVELGENDNNLRAAAAVLSSHDDEIQGGITSLRKTDNDIDRKIAELNRSNNELLEDAAQGKQTTAAKVEEINEISETYSDIEAELARLKESDVRIDGKIEGLNKRNTEIESGLNGLLSVDVQLRAAIDALQTANAVHQDNIGYLRRNDTAFGLQISDLLVTDRVIDTQIIEVISSGSAVRSAIQVAQVQQRDVRSQLDQITNQLLVIENQVQTSQITSVSKTTSTLVLKSCTRGMPHDKPRASMILDDDVPALCDTETDNGGWVVVQRRTSGDQKFYRTWSDYKLGFGNPYTDFYIGNDNIAKLTAAGFTEARIDLVYKGKSYYAHYAEFSVEGEESKYRLHVSDYEGTAPDSLTYHNGAQFSTYDEDNDSSNDNCAESKKGGWWYVDCYESNLNGVWGANDETGVVWKGLSDDESVSFTEIKLRASTSSY